MTVSFRQWVADSIENLRSDKPLPSRLFRPAYYVYVASFLSLTKRWPYGTNVFSRDWDALIILDACRVDALRAVADEYEFLGEVGSITSVGSTSFEWMNHTFGSEYRDEIRKTGYVTGNGYTDSVLEGKGETGNAALPFGPARYDVVDPDDFAYLEEWWRKEFDDDSEWMVGTGDVSRIGPRYTTDRAISVGRNVDPERLMVHYMYPHDPFPQAGEDLRSPFERLRQGSLSAESVWSAYLDNLRLVLDEVEVLLKNLDADDVVVTADHGEAFGEFEFYRHVIGCPLPCMRQVPWVETTAEDRHEHEPTAARFDSDDTATTAEERLQDLGYL